MKIKLKRLKLNNFQGIKSFELTPEGEDLSIFGDNAAGKTTVANAFTWLLFDKDTQGKKDFAIKTLDENGEPIHGLCHQVVADMEVDSETIQLSKSYKEKFVKKRGAVEREFTGHTTDYEINGVPAKKKESDAKIAEIADESTFKLLTSPTYFNEQLAWQDRRKVLIDVCGNVSNETVLELMFPKVEDKDLYTLLANILNQRTINDHQKVLASRRRKINEKLKELPARIDEAELALPEKPKESKTALSKKLRETKISISQKQKEKESVELRGGESKLLKKKSDLEAKLADIRRDHYKEFDGEIKGLRKKSNDLYDRFNDLEMGNRGKEIKITKETEYIKQLEEGIKIATTRMAPMREEFTNLSDKEWVGDKVCPTCGQDLPEDEVEAARDKFNVAKSEKLEEINEDGKRLKALVVKSVKLIEAAKQKILELEAKKAGTETVQAAIDAVQGDIDKKEDQRERYSEFPGYQAVVEQIKKVDEDISAPDEGKQSTIEAIHKEIRTLDARRQVYEDGIAASRQRAKGESRIKELKADERLLAAEYEKLERELYLTEEFIKTKVAMLEEKINSHFEIVKFKLFEIQINEGVKEICEATVNGVPYSSGLNGGGKINAGLDIINALSKYYNFYPPIFTDNAESVTKLLPTESQMIRLVVSEGDRELRIEPSGQISKKAA